LKKDNSPSFLIVGAQKCGTTWLGRVLSQHPEIFFYPDEIGFFDNPKTFSKGKNYYFSYFSKANECQIIGEKSPHYLICKDGGKFNFTEGIHKKIKSYLPDVKIIVLMRNPIERATSAYNHHVRLKNISPIKSINRMLLNQSNYETIKYLGILEFGLYYDYVIKYLDEFESENILLMFYEDLMKDKELSLSKICDFLKVPDYSFKGTSKNHNKYNRSLFTLTIEYYLSRDLRMLRHLDHYIPVSKHNPNKELLMFLKDYYSKSNDLLKNVMGYLPDNWEN